MTARVSTGLDPSHMSAEEALRLRLWTEVRHEGGNPSQLLELLAHIVDERIWERLVDPAGEVLTFRAMIEEPAPLGIGMEKEDLLTFIQLHHRHEEHDETTRTRMAAMRRAVRDLLCEPLGLHGGRRHGQDGDHILRYTPPRTGPNGYLLRRLRRDRPELAAMVLDGEMTTNSAAIVAGIRQHRVSVPLDVDRAAAKLRKAFPSPSDQLRLATAIIGGSETGWAANTQIEGAAPYIHGAAGQPKEPSIIVARKEPAKS